MNDLNKNFEQNIKEIFKELKTEPVVNKVYLSKITFFNGGISLILFIIGFVLIYFSIINRDSLEEFSMIPLILGIVDFIFATFCHSFEF